MTSSSDKRGFTLVELMVVIAVLGIMLTMIYSVFISQMRSHVWRGQVAERQQNLRAAMNLMVSELKMATALTNKIDDDTAVADDLCIDTFAFKLDKDVITYFTNGTRAVPGKLYRDFFDESVGANGTHQVSVIADNIIDLSFSCFNRVGNEMSVDAAFKNATDYNDIRRIDISLSGATAKVSPVTGAISNRTISGGAELRNLPMVTGSGCGVLYFDIDTDSVTFCDPPGETAGIRIKLCNLSGSGMGGDVDIYPKEGQPIDLINPVNGTLNVAADVTTMTIPDPAATCADTPWSTADVTASDPSAETLKAGRSLEMVTFWTPTGCSYNIVTSQSLSIERGHPYLFKDAALGISPGIVNACQSDDTHASLSARVEDACENPVSGETVTFNASDDGVFGEVTDNNDGTYTTVYNGGSAVGTITITAEDLGIVNASNQTITNTITLEPNDPASFSEISAPFDIADNNCPNTSNALEFKVQDACGNDVPGQFASVSNSIAPAVGNVALADVDGTKISVTHTTDAVECGDDAAATITISHNDFGSTLTPSVALQQCPIPGLDVNITAGTMPGTPPYEVPVG